MKHGSEVPCFAIAYEAKKKYQPNYRVLMKLHSARCIDVNNQSIVPGVTRRVIEEGLIRVVVSRNDV